MWIDLVAATVLDPMVLGLPRIFVGPAALSSWRWISRRREDRRSRVADVVGHHPAAGWTASD